MAPTSSRPLASTKVAPLAVPSPLPRNGERTARGISVGSMPDHLRLGKRHSRAPGGGEPIKLALFRTVAKDPLASPSIGL